MSADEEEEFSEIAGRLSPRSVDFKDGFGNVVFTQIFWSE